MSAVFVGIDPGVTGALVVLEDGELEFHDTVTYQDGKRTRIDAAGCAALLRDVKRDCLPRPIPGNPLLTNQKTLFVYIEKSQPMPKNGSIGCFGLGYSYGVWIGILAALEIPYQLVTPQAWKKLLMPGEPKDKDASRTVARRLWPDQTEEALSRKKDHGRSDAALIAEYCRRMAR